MSEKNVLDFIEDFINHRFWAMRKHYKDYFPDIDELKFGFPLSLAETSNPTLR